MSSDRTVPSPVRGDRAVGVVLGSAAGDALGAGYEFGPALPVEQAVHMNGGGAFGWQPGEWTDDTQMALAILTPVAAGDVDLARIEAGFRAWFASRPADVGAQTSTVLRSTGPLADAAAAFTANRPDGAAGNGSLMRTGPVALAHPGDPADIADLAHKVSSLTHPDSGCVDACILWSVAIDHTIHHAPASDEAWDFADALHAATAQLDENRRDRWHRLIDEAATASPLDFPNNGWIIHAFQAALAAICSTPVPDGTAPGAHLRLALETAVRAGGDTDTVAAIAGALLGARWGATALPTAWRRRLHGRSTYDSPPLNAAHLERLARLAARGGRSDQHGWPATTTMLPHYNEVWPSTPLRATLGGVEFGNVAGLPGAIAGGADTVISLCRMGTNDVPAEVEHHVYGLLDTTPEDNPNLDLLLADLIDAIQTYVDEGRHVYVHCVQAQNRTPTLAAAWLQDLGVPADEALATASHALNEPKALLAAAVQRLRSGSQQRLGLPILSEPTSAGAAHFPARLSAGAGHGATKPLWDDPPMLGDPASGRGGYDVIGDVHGQHQELINLLDRLGYSNASGAHHHRNRQAIFVGDLIDRGPGQVEVLRTVRAMVKAGSAQVVLGNHEFNAIAYATPDPKHLGEYLRPHIEKNRKQHGAFLSQLGADSAERDETVAWFKTLPLWLDLGDLRVVHACWDPEAMAGLGSPFLDDQAIVQASRPDNSKYGWVENLCKGPEVRLPNGLSFDDKGGHERYDARFRWWDPQAITYDKACEVPGNMELPNDPVERPPVEPYRHDVPVIFGHYWRTWPEFELTATTACVDYSAGTGGPLVAYRWTGETELRTDHLVSSRP